MSEKGFLKGRALDLFRLDPPVRRIVFTTGLVLLAVAVGCAVREDFPGPVVQLRDDYVLPIAVMLIAGATTTFAVTLIVTGAAHARSRWRYLLLTPLALGLPVVLLAALNTVDMQWSLTLLRTVIVAAIVVPVLCVSVAAFFGARTHMMLLFKAVFAFTACCTVTVIAISYFVTANFGSSFILYMVVVVAVVLEPALLVVGFDLADIGSDATALGANFIERKGGALEHVARIAFAVLAVGAAAALFYFVRYRSAENFTAAWFVCAGWFVGICVAIALTAILMARRRDLPAASHGPHYQYLLLVAAVVTVSAVALSFSSEPLLGLYSVNGLRGYSFAPPDGLAEFGAAWPMPGSVYEPRWPTRRMFAGENGWPLVAVEGLPRAPFAKPEDHFTSLNGMISRKDLSKIPIHIGSPDSDGWARTQADAKDKSGKAFHFAILRREVPTQAVATDMDWYIICGDVSARIGATTSRCETLAASFKPQAREHPSRRLVLIFDLLFFAAAAVTLAIVTFRGRRTDSAGFDFVFWVLFLNALRGVLGYADGGLDYAYYDPNVGALLLCTLLAVSGVVGFALELWPQTRARPFDLAAARRIAGRASANLLVVSGLFVLYIFAIKSSDESQIIRGVIICFALLWELLMSGERLNLSTEHHLFPRSSRVFILIGYLLLVSTTVFLMTGLVDTNGKPATAWNTELFVAIGIVLLAPHSPSTAPSAISAACSPQAGPIRISGRIPGRESPLPSLASILAPGGLQISGSRIMLAAWRTITA